MATTARELGVSINCATCDNQIRLGDETCSACKRVVTSDEIAALRRRWEAADPEAARRSNDVAYGRASLLVVAGLLFIEALIYGVINESLKTFVFGSALSAMMIGLFFVGRRDPLAAMIAGLTVYVLLEVIAAIATIVSLAQGVLIKFLVIAALITGISAERQLRKHQKP